jgi:hypothetical protein
MRTTILRPIILACLLVLSKGLHAHVALDFPLGGETFVVGQSIVISWHESIPHNGLNWDLQFSVDSGDTWTPIVLNIPYTQTSYEWEVPDSVTNFGRIRVWQDNPDQDYLDFSLDFTIVANTSMPLLDAPASDIFIPCHTANQQAAIQAWLDNHGGASATNFCGNLIWTHDYSSISNGCGASGFAWVTFTATDQCGNTQTTAQLTVGDNLPPSMMQHANDMLVETDGHGNQAALNAWLSSRAGAMATDVCGEITWSHNFTALQNECGSTGHATVIFTALDDCGNASSTSATFTIVDLEAPILVRAASDTLFECSEMHSASIQQWLNNHGGAVAYDVGGTITWENFISMQDSCGESGSFQVGFIASDGCGNSITTAADAHITDQSAPLWNVLPVDTAVFCGTSPLIIQQWLDRHAGAQAYDVCGDVNWTHSALTPPDSCIATTTLIITFTAWDECLNSSEANATITFVDTTVTAADDVAQPSILVYPNPASDFLYITFGEALTMPVDVRLNDLSGKLMYSITNVERNLSIPLQDCHAGFYIIHVDTPTFRMARKVIIK